MLAIAPRPAPFWHKRRIALTGRKLQNGPDTE